MKHTIYYLRLLCRYFIAFAMFAYATGKILKTQFNLPDFYKEIPAGDLSGFELTWLFYGYSYPYGLCIALTQIVTGIMMLFRKTVRMATVLLLSFMVNILLLDFFYDIAAKSMAVALVFMAGFLLFSDFGGFSSYFFNQAPIGAGREPGLVAKQRWLKYVISGLVIFTPVSLIAYLKTQYMPVSELHGVWNCTSSMTPQGANYISKIYFDNGNTVALKSRDNRIYVGRMIHDKKDPVKIRLTYREFGKRMGNGDVTDYGMEGVAHHSENHLTISGTTGKDTVWFDCVKIPEP